MSSTPTAATSLYRRLDALILILLVLARIRIDTLAEAAVLPLRQTDVARHPWLGHLLPQRVMEVLAQQQLVDPIGLLLIVATVGCLVAYLLIVEFTEGAGAGYRWRLILIWAIVLLVVFAPAVKLVLLRQQSGPASYSHDGGVIQTEATITYFLDGRNPYVEDYLGTPMAEWGLSEFRSALYHYPYLPWTFVFSAPFKVLFTAITGWYDQRFVYLLLFAMTLALAPGLATARLNKLSLVMALGLNPLMGSDLIYGQNDSFVLAWVVLSLWLLRQAETVMAHGRPASARAWLLGSAAAMGLACASKPTAWFLMPFYLLLLAGGEPTDLWRRPWLWVRRALALAWPALVVVLVVVGPYVVLSPAAIIDDVWRWSAGTSETPYQIWGWGASNLVLALGLVRDRFDPWPFWLPELLVALPLLVILLRRQARENNASRALWGYALLLLAFLFVSRFLNENYLGYLAAFVAMASLLDIDAARSVPSEAAAAT